MAGEWFGRDAVSAARNVRAFMRGLAQGAATVQTGLTTEQRRNWNINWGALHNVESFMIGYDQEIDRNVDGLEDAGNSFLDALSSPLRTFRETKEAAGEAIDAAAIVFDASREQEFLEAGRTLGTETSDWLNEAADSPPMLAKRGGELAAILVTEAIATLATLGVKKALDVGALAYSLSKRLPDRVRNTKKTGGETDAKMVEDKGTSDKGLESAPDDSQEQPRQVEDDIEREPIKREDGNWNFDPRGPDDFEDLPHEELREKRKEESRISNLGSRKHIKKLDADDGHQDKSEKLPNDENIEERTAGTVADVASTNSAMRAAFGPAVKAIEKSFKKNAPAVRASLSSNFQKKLATLRQRKSEMLDYAQAAQTFDKDHLKVTDKRTLDAMGKNYWEARKLADSYGKIRDETWTLMFNDKELRGDLMKSGLKNPNLDANLREEVTRALDANSVDRLWENDQLREKFLFDAFGMTWPKGSKGKRKAITSRTQKSSDPEKDTGLELEHLTRKSDVPYVALDPEVLVPTTKRVNGTINEAIRSIEQEALEGAFKLNSTDIELLEDFIRVNRDELMARNPKKK